MNQYEPKVYYASNDIKRLRKRTKNSVGYDIFSPIDVIIQPQRRVVIDTGIAIEPPTNTYFRIESCSKLASLGIHTLGGQIDNDYRGNYQVILNNCGLEDFHLYKDDKIAQLVLAPSYDVVFKEVCKKEDLSITERVITQKYYNK